MKILKKPEQIIYDTRKPNELLYKPRVKNSGTPLHAVTGKSDWDSLLELFPTSDFEEHPIFRDFSSSWYYVIEK